MLAECGCCLRYLLVREYRPVMGAGHWTLGKNRFGSRYDSSSSICPHLPLLAFGQFETYRYVSFFFQSSQLFCLNRGAVGNGRKYKSPNFREELLIPGALACLMKKTKKKGKEKKKKKKKMKKITILFQPVSLEHSYNYLGQEGNTNQMATLSTK